MSDERWLLDRFPANVEDVEWFLERVAIRVESRMREDQARALSLRELRQRCGFSNNEDNNDGNDEKI